jgi:hypothetical protein
VLPGAVPLELVRAARAMVDAQIADASPETRASRDEELQALFHSSQLAAIMSSAMGSHKPVKGCQVALRYPQERSDFGGNVHDAPMSNPFGWGGHIDGLNSFFWNEPEKGAGQVDTPNDHFSNFDCLVGVPLNDQLNEDSGNLGLLPYSHTTNAEFFSHQRSSGGPLGPGGYDWKLIYGNGRALPPPSHTLPGAVQGGDGTWFPRPEQIKLRCGDAVLAHYLTGHGELPPLFLWLSFCLTSLSWQATYRSGEFKTNKRRLWGVLQAR